MFLIIHFPINKIQNLNWFDIEFYKMIKYLWLIAIELKNYFFVYLKMWQLIVIGSACIGSTSFVGSQIVSI